jgi:CheY-like chemotaxis protein
VSARILIVEDDEDKAAKLAAFLLERHGIVEPVIARSLQSGLRAALEGHVDLMLLDMTMTNFDRTLKDDGGRPHAFAGREILRQMQREGVSFPVIVVTQFDRFGEEDEAVTLTDLIAELRSRFPDFVGTVYYRSNVDDWKPMLDQLIVQHLPARS